MRTSFYPIILFVVTVGLVGCGGADDESTMPAEEEPMAESTAADDTMRAEAGGTAQKINLNTATSEEFLTIPEVGDRMVHEFEEYRPYVSIQQFRQEIGKYVDEEQVAAYEEYVYVPVSPNESDEATLMQLPGVDTEAAAQLTAGRPYASDNEFLEALAEHVSPEQVEQAEMYLASQ